MITITLTWEQLRSIAAAVCIAGCLCFLAYTWWRNATSGAGR
jgi:hypothetical protein